MFHYKVIFKGKNDYVFIISLIFFFFNRFIGVSMALSTVESWNMLLTNLMLIKINMAYRTHHTFCESATEDENFTKKVNKEDGACWKADT